MKKGNDVKKRLGIAIRELRLSRGYTQLQVAEMTGMPRTTISRVEVGEYNISIEILNTIVEALDGSIEICY